MSVREDEGDIVDARLHRRQARVVGNHLDPDTHLVETRQRGRGRDVREEWPPSGSGGCRERFQNGTRGTRHVDDPNYTDDTRRSGSRPIHSDDAAAQRRRRRVCLDHRLTYASGLVVFVPATPLTPAQTPAFTSRWSHEDSVFAESCRNTAVAVPESQAADTFPRALVSKVHGVSETKSPSMTWFAVSARSEIPAAPMVKVGSKLPFAAKSPGRSHGRLGAGQGRVA